MSSVRPGEPIEVITSAVRASGACRWQSMPPATIYLGDGPVVELKRSSVLPEPSNPEVELGGGQGTRLRLTRPRVI